MTTLHSVKEGTIGRLPIMLKLFAPDCLYPVKLGLRKTVDDLMTARKHVGLIASRFDLQLFEVYKEGNYYCADLRLDPCDLDEVQQSVKPAFPVKLQLSDDSESTGFWCLSNKVAITNLLPTTRVEIQRNYMKLLNAYQVRVAPVTRGKVTFYEVDVALTFKAAQKLMERP